MSIVSKVQNRIGESKKKKYLKKDLKKIKLKKFWVLANSFFFSKVSDF